MTSDDLLSRLDCVRRSGKGWTARCPAHDDRSPSLSIREGDRGVLLRCWSGCSLDEVCTALGIQKRDLFFDEQPNPKHRAETRSRRRMGEVRHDLGMAKSATLREAEAVIHSATGVDISQWMSEELDRVMEAVGSARLILIEEERRS